MQSKHRIAALAFAAGLIVAGGAWLMVHRMAPPDAVPAPSGPGRAAPAREPGVLRFAPGAPQLAALKVAAAERAPLPLSEPLNGRLAYDENVTARVSSPIAGRVTRLIAQPGDAVKAGDALLLLDSPDLAQAAADLDKARADETRTRLALERATSLYEGGVAARKDYENAAADAEQARAEAVRARLRLKNLTPAEQLASGFALRAPIAGTVADRQANPGMEVRPDLAAPLFVITDPTRLWVIADLPERALGKVAVGHSASVEVDAYPDQRLDAIIERIGEVVDPATRRVPVRMRVGNADRRLKPEMYARVRLLADAAKSAVRVPNSALVTSGVYSYVFVETEPGVFVRRKVSPAFEDRDWVYVADGLTVGDRVVTAGALLLNSELQEKQ